MAVTNVTRNLRDGELVIKDASSPAKSMLVLLDEGDLSWTVRQRTVEIKDRGSIAYGHTRRGDEESVQVSFSAKWTQLVGKSAAGGDPYQLYEMLMFLPALGLVSTSGVGEQETLRLEFTVYDPAGVAGERVVFSKVYRETLTMSERDDYNVISFTGRDFEVAPVVSRV